MFSQLPKLVPVALTLLASMQIANAASIKHSPRQVPANPTGVTTITSPAGVQIRYKEPGTDGFCETTPGVKSYSGYIDLAPDAHTFFYFFEARTNPATAPITLWLNGGPGSSSLIGLFQEHGPCNVTEDLMTSLNPYSWNEASNMLYIDQPFGTGFSYSSEIAGSLNNVTGWVENASYAGVQGEYPIINASAIDKTDLAAIAAWHIIQGFYSALPQLDATVESKTFNLWTESYGGHYGPSFYNYFYDQNELIANGTMNGTQLNFDTLGIINGIIDDSIQAEYYPIFAVNNTYGIKAVNDTVASYMQFACFMINGCLDQIEYCRQTDKTTLADYAICSQAQDMCRDNVESPYYAYGGRGVYDIRHPIDDPTPPRYFVDLLNTPAAQQALGVNLNYTEANDEIYYAFQTAGDFVYTNLIQDLEMILDNGVSVNLVYGDADYICNWFGGQAISLALNYTHSAEFRATGYVPFVVDGTEYGEVRQYGNFSFLRMYESGHEVPYYQPLASLASFERALGHLVIADGSEPVSATYGTNGMAKATHTEPFVALPSTTSTSMSSMTATATSNV